MAVTSIWHIKGSLGTVLAYAKNPGKTENPLFDDLPSLSEEDAQGLADVMAYAINPSKTEQRLFVSGINCRPTVAREQMMSAKHGFGKDDGIIAWHGYQSFKPGEVTPEIAHEIGVKLAERLWGDSYQVVVATHLDREHIHNHLILNSVSHVDGKRYHRTAQDYRDLQAASDELCREYALSVIEDPKSGKSKQYAEWQADRDGKPTWRSVIKSDIDECVSKASSRRQFFENLEALGYEYKIGKDISVRPPGKERFFRLMRNFGDGYSIEAISQRIHDQSDRSQRLPVPKRRHPEFIPPKKLPFFARGSIVALHRYYLYLLGYYQQRGSPGTNARMHYLLREDIRKLDEYIADTKLLGREKIATAEQLFSFKDAQEAKVADLIDKRTCLRSEIRVLVGPGNHYSTKDNPEYQSINRELKKLRKEVAQCERIALRSKTLLERIERIEKDEDRKLSPKQRKEATDGRRSRTGDRPDHADHADGR